MLLTLYTPPFGPNNCTSYKAFLTAPSNQIYFQCIFKIFQTFGWFFIIFISFFLEYSLKFDFEFLKRPSLMGKMPPSINLKVLFKAFYEQILNYHLNKNRLYQCFWKSFFQFQSLKFACILIYNKFFWLYINYVIKCWANFLYIQNWVRRINHHWRCCIFSTIFSYASNTHIHLIWQLEWLTWV